MIIFYGATPQGQPVKLMQHVTQTNVMLTVMAKQKEHKEAKRIGFRSEDLIKLGEEKSSLSSPEGERVDR